MLQESTFVAHGHIGAVFKRQLLIGLHYIDVFANDNERAGSYTADGMGYGGMTTTGVPAGRPTVGPGSDKPSITIYGGDIKL